MLAGLLFPQYHANCCCYIASAVAVTIWIWLFAIFFSICYNCYAPTTLSLNISAWVLLLPLCFFCFARFLLSFWPIDHDLFAVAATWSSITMLLGKFQIKKKNVKKSFEYFLECFWQIKILYSNFYEFIIMQINLIELT